MVFGEPEPLQPTDAPDDRMLTFEVACLSRNPEFPVDMLKRVEFECSKCHTHYWRDIDHKEAFEEVVYVEDIGPYALNPHLESAYAPNPHTCSA